MLSFILENIATIIVSAVLLIIIAGVIFKMVSDRKKGKSSCGGACGCCPMSENCAGRNKNDKV